MPFPEGEPFGATKCWFPLPAKEASVRETLMIEDGDAEPEAVSVTVPEGVSKFSPALDTSTQIVSAPVPAKFWLPLVTAVFESVIHGTLELAVQLIVPPEFEIVSGWAGGLLRVEAEAKERLNGEAAMAGWVPEPEEFVAPQVAE